MSEDIQILRRAVLLAIKELDEAADMLGGEGFFTRAKRIKIDVLHKLGEALEKTDHSVHNTDLCNST